MRNYSLIFFLGFYLYSNVANGQIPMSMWRKMVNVTSTSEFIDRFVSPRQLDTGTRPKAYSHQDDGGTTEGISNKMEPSQRDALSSLVADEEPCVPQPQIVSIPADGDLNIIRWPTCTRIDRCGGCCGHDLLYCAATHVQMQPVQVLRARYPYPGADRFVVEGVEEVLIERHLACECRCRVQPHQCSPERHQYDPDSCSCRCLNEGQSETCTSAQRWDDQSCSCVCDSQQQCSEDETYNNSTCSCELLSNRPSVILNDITPTTATSQAADPTTSADACRDVRCLSGFVPQVLSNECRCLMVPQYPTSSRANVAEDILHTIEAVRYQHSDQPVRADPPLRPHSEQPRPYLHTVFNQELSPPDQQKASVSEAQDQADGTSRDSQSEQSDTQPSTGRKSQNVGSSHSSKSEDVESSQQAILQTDRRHHVEAVAPAVHARRYSGSHRPDRGDPIQFMQPMVQGLHGHGHGHA